MYIELPLFKIIRKKDERTNVCRICDKIRL